MPAHAPAIFLSDRLWSVGLLAADGSVTRLPVPLEPDAALPEQAAALVSLLHEQGVAAKNPVLVVPSAWCLAASIDISGLLKRQRREAMLYRLEEMLPLDAEDLAADFISAPNAALGVCVSALQLAPALAALDSAGLRAGPICPQALLALQTLLALPEAPATALYLLQMNERVDLLLVRDGVLRRWESVAAELATLGPTLRRELLDLDEPCPLISVGLAKHLQAGLAPNKLTELDSPALDEAVVQAAACIAVRGERPLINLRRGPLAPADPFEQVQRPLTAAVLSVALLLACLSGAALWRAHHYDQLAGQFQDQQRVAFREAFPDQAPPAAPLGRLRSEASKLRGLRGAGPALPASPTTLTLLQQTLTALPTDLRYRVLELRVDEQRLYLTGQTRSHGDANTLADILRQQTGLAVPSLRTEQLADGNFAFTITAPLAVQEVRP